MFEILNNWNKSPKSLRDEQNLKAFKKIIIENQNQFKKCEIKNCNSCHWENNKENSTKIFYNKNESEFIPWSRA